MQSGSREREPENRSWLPSPLGRATSKGPTAPREHVMASQPREASRHRTLRSAVHRRGKADRQGLDTTATGPHNGPEPRPALLNSRERCATPPPRGHSLPAALRDFLCGVGAASAFPPRHPFFAVVCPAVEEHCPWGRRARPAAAQAGRAGGSSQVVWGEEEGDTEDSAKENKEEQKTRNLIVT